MNRISTQTAMNDIRSLAWMVQDREGMLEAYLKLLEKVVKEALAEFTDISNVRITYYDDCSQIRFNILWFSEKLKKEKLLGYVLAPVIIFPTSNLFITPNSSANSRDQNAINLLIKILQELNLEYDATFIAISEESVSQYHRSICKERIKASTVP